MKKVFDVLKKVFEDWRYVVLFGVIALGFYIMNVAILNIGNFGGFYESMGIWGVLEFLFNSAIGFRFLVTKLGYYLTITIGLLAGVLISLLVYRFNFVKRNELKKTGAFAGIGLFLGILAPGCASCGIGLAAVLGLGASLAVLPLKGAEISIFAVCILFFSIFRVSKSLANDGVCEIKYIKKTFKYDKR
jgi:hypothetical protein